MRLTSSSRLIHGLLNGEEGGDAPVLQRFDCCFRQPKTRQLKHSKLRSVSAATLILAVCATNECESQ